MSDRAAGGYDGKLERGINAVLRHLEAGFPGHSVEVLDPSSRDNDRSLRTFKVRSDGQKYLLRVPEVLLGLQDITERLEQSGVARALQRAGVGLAVLVTPGGVRIEPIEV